MIRIEAAEPGTDEWREWCEQCTAIRDLTIADFSWETKPEIDEKLYKGQKAYFVDPSDGPPFFGKCAYCEQRITADQDGDVEHYRPKGRVRTEGNVPVRILVDGYERDHPGYFWLAYDWTNLLPSCILCNQIRVRGGVRFGKGERFPVSGDYAWEPGKEVEETPLLVNPRFDDPANHFVLERETGLLIYRSERGNLTIRILGLNQRNLPQRRLEVIEDVQNRVLAEFAKGLHGTPMSLDRLIAIKVGKSELAIAGRLGLESARDTIEHLHPVFAEATNGPHQGEG